jgi:hypothetical protein
MTTDNKDIQTRLEDQTEILKRIEDNTALLRTLSKIPVAMSGVVVALEKAKGDQVGGMRQVVERLRGKDGRFISANGGAAAKAPEAPKPSAPAKSVESFRPEDAAKAEASAKVSPIPKAHEPVKETVRVEKTTETIKEAASKEKTSPFKNQAEAKPGQTPAQKTAGGGSMSSAEALEKARDRQDKDSESKSVLEALRDGFKSGMKFFDPDRKSVV